MTMLTRAEAAGFLLTHDNYSILTHRRPDGDTLGSAAALCLGLRQLGKEAWILENPETSAQLAFLCEGISKAGAEETDTVIAVDVADAGLLPRAFAPLAGRCRLAIDHHGSCTPFAEHTCLDGQSASCAELVWDILAILGVEMDEAIADAVYVGASTDTGCFRYANTNAHSFFTAALCAQHGADIHGLNQELFETNSLAKLRLQGWIVENIKLFDEGRLAIVSIPRAVEDLLGVSDGDTNNISSFARTLEGVKMAATLRQSKDGKTKISVRAVPGYDAAAVCAHFGGGGHPGAAGATTNLSLEETAEKLEAVMLQN